MRVRLPRFPQIAAGASAANLTIAAAAVAALTIALWLAQGNQDSTGVTGIPVMIPQHSAALLTSERAHVSDPRVGHIPDGVLEAQQREIIALRQRSKP